MAKNYGDPIHPYKNVIAKSMEIDERYFKERAWIPFKDRDKLIIIRTRSYEDQRIHFIERLLDRYGLTITESEYDALCNPHKIFHGALSKARRKTIGWIFIQNVKVWVLRDGEANRLSTCYPPSVETDHIQMLKAFFGGTYIHLAEVIYELYLKEAKKMSKLKFESQKEAALFFFSKTIFAPLHMEVYKYGYVRPVKVAAAIHRILNGKNEHVSINLRRKK